MHFLVVSRQLLQRIIILAALTTVSCSYMLFWLDANKTTAYLRNLTVLVDPGHGGVDSGTHDVDGNPEKAVNLAVALKIRDQLKNSGIQVVMTREIDTDLAPFTGTPGRHRRDLLKRIETARKYQCLFLVSIHCDSINDSRRFGAVAFYNSRIPVSKTLATNIQEELNALQTRSFKAAPGDYLILKQSGVNGALIEIGFLSNPNEALNLQNEDHQNNLALAITRGILKSIEIAQ